MWKSKSREPGYDGRGKRQVKKAYGKTKTEAVGKLRQILRDRKDGLAQVRDDRTVHEAVEDWLEFGLVRQSKSTTDKYAYLCEKHIIPLLGARKLRDLTAHEVETWLAGRAKVLSSETLRRTHACLNRSVRRAMARDWVKRNVVELAEVPAGLPGGRPSRSLLNMWTAC